MSPSTHKVGFGWDRNSKVLIYTPVEHFQVIAKGISIAQTRGLKLDPITNSGQFKLTSLLIWTGNVLNPVECPVVSLLTPCYN